MDWKRFRPAPAGAAAVSGKAFALQDAWRLADGTAVTLRAARHGDDALIQQLVRSLSMESRYRRYFYPLHELPPAMLARATRQAPLAGVTLLVTTRLQGVEVALAMAEYVTVRHPDWCEFAVVVADSWQRRGLATRMLQALICIARGAGLARMDGDVLAENVAMLRLLNSLGFRLGPHPDGPALRKAWKDLEQPDWPCPTRAALTAPPSGWKPAIRNAPPARPATA